MSDLHQLREALPESLTAGDALAATLRTGLPASSVVFFVLTGLVGRTPVRHFLGGNGAEITNTSSNAPAYAGLAVAADGTVALSISSAASAAWQPGRYQWVAFAVDGLTGNRSRLAEGAIRILPNPTAAVPHDPRTRNERILANLRALLEGKSLDDVQMYKIGTRELTKMSLPELMQAEAVYARKCSKRKLNSVAITFGGR